MTQTTLPPYVAQILQSYELVSANKESPLPPMVPPFLETKVLTESQKNRLAGVLKNPPSMLITELRNHLTLYKLLLSYRAHLTDAEQFWVKSAPEIIEYVSASSMHNTFPGDPQHELLVSRDKEVTEYYFTLFALMEYYVRHLSE